MEVKLLRTRFKDVVLEENFERDGYVVIKNMVDREGLRQMTDLFDRHYKIPTEKMVSWNTAAMLGEEEKNLIRCKCCR